MPARAVLFTGPPGTGKTSLAEAIAIELGAPVVSWDWMMSAVRGFPGVWKPLEPDGRTRRDLGYELMSRVLEYQLRLDQPTVLDCVARHRAVARWSALSDRYHAPFAVVECRCSDLAVHRSRIEGRSRGIPGWDELDWDHVAASRAWYRPSRAVSVTVDADDPFERNLQRVRESLGLP